MSCACKLSRGNEFIGLPDRLAPRLLSGLSKDDLHAVLSLARHQRFTGPSVIVHQGDAADRFYILTSGQGAHFVETNAGRKIVLFWLTAGQVFGGAAALSRPIKYLASTEVHIDSCALVWSRQAIRDLLARFPLLLDNGLSIAVTEHLAWLMGSRVSVGSDDASVRVARLLVSVACGIGKPGPDGIELLVANEDLAAGASVTPYTVSRVLAQWQRSGILTKGRGKILLRRPELLASPF